MPILAGFEAIQLRPASERQTPTGTPHPKVCQTPDVFRITVNR